MVKTRHNCQPPTTSSSHRIVMQRRTVKLKNTFDGAVIIAALLSITSLSDANHNLQDLENSKNITNDIINSRDYDLAPANVGIPTVTSSQQQARTQTTYVMNNSDSDPCNFRYEDGIQDSVSHCNWTWDGILCWPPAPAGTFVRQQCPPAHGIDITKFAERHCGVNGRWDGRPDHPNGWTNYTPCYTPEILELMRKLYAGGNGEAVKIKFDIAERTRTLEIIGFTLSLFALAISLIIFCNFRSLRNNRTRIHKNLFVAMVIQVIIRLTLYLDQAIVRSGQPTGGNNSRHGIDNTPYVCEASYVFLEYARTAMFTWMFIEGLYLHNVVTVTVFQGRFPYRYYLFVGWGGPVIMTVIWAGFTAEYKGQHKCWWGYNLTSYYWILEGPRLAVILLNFLFLLNIIRVLVVKLRESHRSDIEQVRKAVRAAVVLLPLLGITNLLNMTEAPLERTVLEFALWSYITHFLTSFQGLFIAAIYCFLNGEVRAALLKSLSVYMSLHGHSDWIPRPVSIFSAAYNTGAETEAHCNESVIRPGSSPSRYSNDTDAKGTSTMHAGENYTGTSHPDPSINRRWMPSILRVHGQRIKRHPSGQAALQESVVFELSEH